MGSLRRKGVTFYPDGAYNRVQWLSIVRCLLQEHEKYYNEVAKMTKTSPVVLAAGAVVVLLASLGVGLGIKKIRSKQAETKAKPTAKQIETVTVSESSEAEEETKVVVEAVVTEVNVVAEEEVIEEEEEEAEEIAKEETDESGEKQTAAAETRRGRQFGNWQQILADLNLTEEEKGRLQAGFGLAMQRWQSMLPEEREFETARRREMRERWMNMSDEERDESVGRMRGRFEEWRNSDSVELPEMTLD